MKLSRRVHTWLADRTPIVQHPRLYRSPSHQTRASVPVWDAALVAIVGVVLLLLGLAGLVVATVLILALFTSA